MSFNPYQFQIDELTKKLAENELLLEDPELGELAQLEQAELKLQLTELEKVASEFETSSEGGGASEASASGQITNCVIEVRQGTGGDEAKIWGNDLMRMYMRFLERIGLKYEMMDDLVIKVKGKVTDPELITQLRGELAEPLACIYPYDLFKFESGVHRVQRVPETESQGRIHTSTASVAVIPEVKKTAVIVNDGDLEWEFMRAGGAGGQNVNKVNSAVRLTHVPSGIVVTSRRERSQVQNREIALDLLRGQLWEWQEADRLVALGKARAAIGRNMRSEKIRTFNYAQNRVTDHRVNISWYNLENIVEGDLTDTFREVWRGLELATDQPDSPAASTAD